MELKEYIGSQVVISLSESAKKNTILDSFYEVQSPIINRLKGVDSVGIWLEGFKTFTFYTDDEGNQLPSGQTKTEDKAVNVLIRWEYIESIFVFDDIKQTTKPIGFNFK